MIKKTLNISTINLSNSPEAIGMDAILQHLIILVYIYISGTYSLSGLCQIPILAWTSATTSELMAYLR